MSDRFVIPCRPATASDPSEMFFFQNATSHLLRLCSHHYFNDPHEAMIVNDFSRLVESFLPIVVKVV
jgi:hypothetical protein